MELIIDLKRKTYTGDAIEPLWAYRQYGIQNDSIVVFRGPMQVELSDMKDLADIKEAKPIYANDAINFVIEHFDYPDIRITYLRQRLLVMIAKEVLEEYSGKRLTRNGDDLYYNNGKLSVSIATSSITSGKIHLGINITNEGTPKDIKTAALSDLGLVNDDQIEMIMEMIGKRYKTEVEKIEQDIRKTLPLLLR